MSLRTLFVFGLLLVAASSHAGTVEEPAAAVRENDARQMQILNDGVKVLKDRHPGEALAQYFDRVIASYETRYPAGAKASYCARSATESLATLVQAAQDKTEAVVVGSAWCDAYFLRAYALVDLGRNAQAREALEKAISMAPRNAQYVAELASLDRREKKWAEALTRFESAAQLARDFSPPESKLIELGQALRGKGYVLVELGRLDDAASAYRQCLELNPADKAAIAELAYVQAQRKRTN